jgi:uncharacterized protein YndB with AHSA1/START domain
MPEPVKLRKLKAGGFQFIQEIRINATPQRSWKALLDIGRWFKFDPAQKPATKLEPWVGGRFFREEPDGESALHATVTYFLPNKLLRLAGPMGMSHLPVNNVFIFELQPNAKGTLLKLCQRSFGFMDPDLKKRYTGGWKKLLPHHKQLAEKSK